MTTVAVYEIILTVKKDISIMLIGTIIKAAHIPSYEKGLKEWEALAGAEQKQLYEDMLHDLTTMIKASEMLEAHTRGALKKCNGIF